MCVVSLCLTGWVCTHQVVDQITQQLYDQTMDAQEGVVYFLLEEMAQQRIKEHLLAYALLLINGARSCPPPFPHFLLRLPTLPR